MLLLSSVEQERELRHVLRKYLGLFEPNQNILQAELTARCSELLGTNDSIHAIFLKGSRLLRVFLLGTTPLCRISQDDLRKIPDDPMQKWLTLAVSTWIQTKRFSDLFLPKNLSPSLVKTKQQVFITGLRGGYAAYAVLDPIIHFPSSSVGSHAA